LAVVDDVHWAARPTLALLGHVARSTDASRLLLVCTARNTSPDDNEALAALAEDLARKGVPSQRLELSGLGLDGVSELVSAAAGRRLDERLRNLAVELVAETAGNPLFVDAVLASLPADPAWRLGALPTNVVETIRRRVARLSPALQDLLRVAAVIGLDFDLRVAARAGQCSELDALEALEAAGRAGLVVESGVNRYRFTHALVRSALRDDVSRSRRVRIHLAVGEAIEEVHGPALDDHTAALSYHFYEAVPAGGAKRAYRYSLLAAERAWRLLSFSEAADAYGRAIELLTHGRETDSLTRARLLLARGTAQRRAGDYGSALETLRTAFAECRDEARRTVAAAAQGAAERVAEAAIAYEDAGFEPGFEGHVAVELLQAAAAGLGDDESPLSILTAASLSRALVYSGRLDEGMATGEAALARARRLGDPAVTGPVLMRTGFSHLQVQDAPAMAELGSELMELGSRLDDGMLQFFASWFCVVSAAQLGDMVAVDRWLDEVQSLGQRVGHPTLGLVTVELRQFRAFMAGDLPLVEHLLEEMQELGLVNNLGLEGMAGVMMFLLRREQGRLAGIVPVLRNIVALNPDAALWGPGLAALYAEVGMLDDARVALERLAADDFTTLPADGTRELCLCLCAEAAAAVADPRPANRLIDHVLPCEGRNMFFWGTSASLGPADRLLGMLASAAGRPEEAESWFGRALAFSRRMDSPLWVAHCLFDWAAHRHRSGGGGDEGMLAEAAELCRRYNLVGLGQKIAKVAP
jgi:tetratricopeptide (TPR) repeat protein